ncbi:hypothetical protein CC80DRAFT_132535 [Byssothecium circinans]|uniref:Uncharacterized protein n=1 Tax=Byssothecium circinans TaxID=147558 RepID=A0A6A5TT58_9PLEO|nr:hypothetical protein CC80DRAFT_132535 [Byssothecium circinans]
MRCPPLRSTDLRQALLWLVSRHVKVGSFMIPCYHITWNGSTIPKVAILPDPADYLFFPGARLWAERRSNEIALQVAFAMIGRVLSAFGHNVVGSKILRLTCPGVSSPYRPRCCYDWLEHFGPRYLERGVMKCLQHILEELKFKVGAHISSMRRSTSDSRPSCIQT